MKTFEEFKMDMQEKLSKCSPWTAMPEGYEANILYALYCLLCEEPSHEN